MKMLLAVIAFASVIVGHSLLAQNAAPDANIKIRVIDGRSGKPMPNQRLLAFIGRSPDEVQAKTQHTVATTDGSGVASLPIAPADTYIQVWVDGRTLCQDSPNAKGYSIRKIEDEGVSTSNNCGHVKVDPKPEEFVVFARPAKLGEKIRW